MSLHDHIYLSANTLARQISEIADERIKPYGISTSYAFLLLTIHESPGIGQKEISGTLNLAPSTLTRFIDKLVNQGYLERKKNGRVVVPVLTKAGSALCHRLSPEIERIENDIIEIAGPKFTDTLNRMLLHGVGTLNKNRDGGV